jgi:hypothetical protein
MPSRRILKRYWTQGRKLICRYQWLRGLRCRSAANRVLKCWVRIAPGAWMEVCCEWCMLSGRGLCDELITHPEESYRLWCVVMCDLETLVNEESLVHWGAFVPKNKKIKKKVNLKTTQHLYLVTRMWNESHNVKVANKFFKNIRSPNNLE